MSKSNLERVQSLYASFAQGDIHAILDALAPEVKWVVQGPESVPMFGSRRGRSQVLEFFQAVVQNLDIQEFEPREFIAQGEQVVVIGKERGRARPTGLPYAGEWVHVWKFQNGQVVHFREFSDTAATAKAFHPLSAA